MRTCARTRWARQCFRRPGDGGGRRPLVAVVAGVSNGVVASACIVYFWARVVHALAFAFAIPWARTLAFVVGFLAQATIAWQILMR